MSTVRFIGCLHFGHNWMARHRGFKDTLEHDETIVEVWNRTVNKKDIVYILGDITMETPDYYYQLDRLKGTKKVVLGNHDLMEHIPELMKYVSGIAGMIDYKECALTHCPIHPNEVTFYKANIHAHIHENKLHEVNIKDRYLDDNSKQVNTLNKYINVDAHLIKYQPKTLEELFKFQLTGEYY